MQLFARRGNRFVWLFTGYAVRPLRTLTAIVFILLIGTPFLILNLRERLNQSRTLSSLKK